MVLGKRTWLEEGGNCTWLTLTDLTNSSWNPWESFSFKGLEINLIETACHAWPKLLGDRPVGGFIY